MNGPTHHDPGAPRPRRRLVGVLLGVCVAVMVANPLTAQVPVALTQADQEFDLMDRRYEDALLAVQVQVDRYDEALANVIDAESDEEYREAQAVFIRESQELQRRETRLIEVRQELDEARETLLQALDRQMTELEARFASASLQERRRLQADLADMGNQYDRLEQEGEEFAEPDTYLSALRLGPRAGPLEIRAVMQVAERRADDAQEAIDRYEADVQRLEQRLRLQRQGGDFSAGLGRFDITRLPTGLERQEARRPEGVAADSTSAQPLTLDEQIQTLRGVQEQLRAYRDEMKAIAADYRRRLERIGVDPVLVLGEAS